MKNSSQDLSNKLLSRLSVQFGPKLIKIEEIDFEQQTVIFSMLHISKKNEVINF
jgi:hypothetical protein